MSDTLYSYEGFNSRTYINRRFARAVTRPPFFPQPRAGHHRDVSRYPIDGYHYCIKRGIAHIQLSDHEHGHLAHLLVYRPSTPGGTRDARIYAKKVCAAAPSGSPRPVRDLPRPQPRWRRRCRPYSSAAAICSATPESQSGCNRRSTSTRVSGRPPRPPRARRLDSAGLMGDGRWSRRPQRPRARHFFLWTCAG